jgi:rod shape-determining protein MreC
LIDVPKTFHGKRIWIASFTIIVMVVLFLSFPPLFTGVRNFTTAILTAPLKAVRYTGRYLETKRELSEENIRLRREVGELSLREETYKELREENERLRELLMFKRRVGYETISAEVIVRDPNDWLGSFVIDKGTDDGVNKGAAVCSAKGLLGKVTEARADSSSVMLVTHPGFKSGGMLKDSRVHGIVEGEGKGYARMLYLPVDAEIKIDEVVITSGLSRVFPKGIAIGRIVSVEKSRTGLFKYALIKPEANAYDQEEVLCIK